MINKNSTILFFSTLAAMGILVCVTFVFLIANPIAQDGLLFGLVLDLSLGIAYWWQLEKVIGIPGTTKKIPPIIRLIMGGLILIVCLAFGIKKSPSFAVGLLVAIPLSQIFWRLFNMSLRSIAEINLGKTKPAHTIQPPR